MNTKHSPGKITLGMMKGKPIATSVPVIHYHASDDELEELYPDTNKDEQFPVEFESSLPKIPRSPSKSPEKKDNTGESMLEDNIDKQLIDPDGNLSEGTPPSSDPWKVLSEIKGKITKTFEETLSEIKSERKKKGYQSRENSSISDAEDLGNITPVESNIYDKQEKESIPYSKGNASRFAAFSDIKIGLKTKNSEEDSIESGVEAAEYNEDVKQSTGPRAQSSTEEYKDIKDVKDDMTLHSNIRQLPMNTMSFSHQTKLQTVLTHLKSKLICQLTYQLVPLFIIVCSSYYFIPLPEYFLGFTTGILMTITFFNTITKIKEILITPPDDKMFLRATIPVLEIPAIEEHSVVERFEGWLNELPYAYNPEDYHVARTKSVFFRLEDSILRVMETRLRIPKRAIWDEPKHKLKFTRKRIYDLTGAKIELLPKGLIRRRRWSKKYPICITLEKGALITNAALKDTSSQDSRLFTKDNDEILVEDNEEGQASDADKFYRQSFQQKDQEEEGESKVLAKELDHDRDVGKEEEIEDYEEEEEEEDTDEDLMHSSNSKDIFEDCQNDEDCETEYKLFIFARTDRQKEEWYRRLTSVTNSHSRRNSISLTCDAPISLNSLLSHQALNESKGSTASDMTTSVSSDLSYKVYMSRYFDEQAFPPTETEELLFNGNAFWINCLLGRILFDMHKCSDASNLIQNKIQRKLSNIKLPYFMESLLVSEVTIGQGAPIIHNARKPIINEGGLWIDLDVTYKASLMMTFETKLNLMKLTRAGPVSSNTGDVSETEQLKTTKSPMFDSDVEDSPETSTEDDDIPSTAICNTSKDLIPVQSSGKKFLNMVDKIAASKYFRHATELSYIRRAMEGVSNTEIRLMVCVSSIEGSLTVNIPPPPSDRLWYGFKPLPKVTLTVKPALGERAVNISYVTKWIETKLLREFEKVVVLPNMDDLLIPLCPNYPYNEM